MTSVSLPAVKVEMAKDTPKLANELERLEVDDVDVFLPLFVLVEISRRS